MDAHQKIVHETLLQMLEELKASGGKASLFVDDQGLSSEEGFVQEITGDGLDKVLHLGNGKAIPLRHVMAVNGVFLTGFSTC